MYVRKVRGQNKVGKIILSRTEVETLRRVGVPIEAYVTELLAHIAKKRKWKWYFNKENT